MGSVLLTGGVKGGASSEPTRESLILTERGWTITAKTEVAHLHGGAFSYGVCLFSCAYMGKPHVRIHPDM